MVTGIQRINGVGTIRRAYALLALLVALGVLVTPVQWYVAYLGHQRAKHRRAKLRRERRYGGRNTPETVNVT